MDTQPFIDLITKTGIWCLTAFIVGRTFFDWIKRDKEMDREDMKEDRAQMYALMERQGNLLEQQKELINRQVLMSEHNKEMLDRLTDIQMLHTNRLDRIEDRLGRLEEETKKGNRA